MLTFDVSLIGVLDKLILTKWNKFKDGSSEKLDPTIAKTGKICIKFNPAYFGFRLSEITILELVSFCKG